MEQNQLLELIRALKPKEIAQIRHFSSNPFFNKGRNRAQITPLLDFFLSHSWDQIDQNLEKKAVFARVFPGQRFVDGKLEKLMKKAHKVVRDILLALRYFSEENEFQQIFDFTEVLRSRGLGARYVQWWSKLQKMQEGASRNAGYFHRQFLLEYSKFDEESIRNQAKGDLNIPNTIHALEAEFYLQRLVLLNQLLLQNKIAHVEALEQDKRFLEECPPPSRFLKAYPLIHINHEIFKLLQKKYPSPSEVQALFDLLRHYEQELEAKSLREFYTHLRNLCVLSISADYAQAEMEQMLHQLYKDNLARGYLHYEGKINRSRYFAVATNALNVADFDWALDFIERYKQELRDENETQDIYRLNLANYLFRMGRFEECLDHIPPTTPFLDYLMVGKRLELKALYELQSDLLPYKLDAFKMFLSRTSQKLLSQDQWQIYSDFANLLYQIVYSQTGESRRAERMMRRVEERKQAAEWRWLYEKAAALSDG